MAKQTIALGTAPTGVGGDTPRSAFTKAQANFDELYDLTANAAKKGANSDITSLSGLTTALSIPQGGTGGKTQALARTGLGLKSASTADILGTVSQTAGVPTGAILESGSNAQGSYVRYADGTQIAWTSLVTNNTATYAVGALWGSDAVVLGSYPASFTGTVNITSGCTRGTSNNGWATCYSPWTTSSWGSWRGLAADNTFLSANIYLTAIGRWF